MFEVVFDYGEHDQESPQPQDRGEWLCRPDPFSSYRAGFEVRTYRLCRRVLMFHHFPEEAAVGRGCLVRSTDFRYDGAGEPSAAEDSEPVHPVASFITSATQRGYRRRAQGYTRRSLPKLEFDYSRARVQDEVRELGAESIENLPEGIGGARQWVDLDGEGLCGVLAGEAASWFYKRNLGGGRFAPLRSVPRVPSTARTDDGRTQLVDLAGDGSLDVVQLDGPTPGFCERTREEGWDRLVPFESLPDINWDAPNLRLADLTGNGHADVLIAEDDTITWYPSLGEKGFERARRVPRPPVGEQGPRLVFTDPEQPVFLADMTGDGLADLVRVSNGEVCYWPNLGHGSFGAKITMDNAPRFDRPGLFDQERVRLADIDGSGTNDIVYLGCEGVSLYFNDSGNRWSPPRPLRGFPRVDSSSTVATVDLFGNGTACLVWSSPLPGDSRRPVRYVDLMGGTKPHLLTRVRNNLSAETRVRYAPSTRFYREDEASGRQWITRVPFPVHVVDRVEIYDHISRNRFVSSYRYHHGYYDGEEREFHGFGLVERVDTEERGLPHTEDAPAEAGLAASGNMDPASYVPPVLTRTWFHTGAWLEGARISGQLEHEYYREDADASGGAPAASTGRPAMLLDDTILPDTVRQPDGTSTPWVLSPRETQNACRALRGYPLREEVYALDGTVEDPSDEAGKADRPYHVTEHSYTVELLQPQGPNQHAVFLTHAREGIECHYERALYGPLGQQHADPRVTHTVTLDTDIWGNVTRAVAIGYGRRVADPDPVLTDDDRKRQQQTLVTIFETRYTTQDPDPGLDPDVHRPPLPWESRSYELIHVSPDASSEDEAGRPITPLFRFDDLRRKLDAAGDGDHELPYEDTGHAQATEPVPYRRLIEHARIRYRSNDLSRLLPLGQHQSHALPGETYTLAFTPGLLSQVFRRDQENLLPTGDADALLAGEGGYVRSEDSTGWWIPSGRVFYHPDPSAAHDEELTFARENFFLPHRFTDPFGRDGTGQTDPGQPHSTIVTYDTPHRLFAVQSRDALDNTVRADYDYRVLQPHEITDANGNRSAAAFDCLGQVVATAVMGKPGDTVGDSLADFAADPDAADPELTVLQSFVADPRGRAGGLLGAATSRTVYDVHRFARCGQPPLVATLVRETHAAESAVAQARGVRMAFTYSDGFGRDLQTKVQAEAGDAPERSADAPVLTGLPPRPSGDVRPGTLLTEEGRLRQVPVEPRWVGTGRTLHNNKGLPVRQYQPFFSSTHLYEEEREMTDAGVSAVVFYDPVGRPVATIHPNHTYAKTVFDPWRQASWDSNDTVGLNPRTDPDVADLVRGYIASQSPMWQTWQEQRAGRRPGETPECAAAEIDAARKAGAHAATPSLTFLDSLGRVFLTAADNGPEGMLTSRVEHDIEGNQRSATDARGVIVMTADFDLIGRPLHTHNPDAGERWTLNDVTGKPIRTWDSRGFSRRVTYDALRRPLEVFLRSAAADSERRVERTVYGEQQGAVANHRGRVFQVFDEAGLVTHDAFDFKGNLLRSTRRLLHDHRSDVDWPALSGPQTEALLEGETFTGSTVYDAFNRPIQIVSPHSDRAGATMNVIRPRYNEAALLEGVDVWLEQPAEPQALLDPGTTQHRLITDIDYNERGERTRIAHGNGVQVTYEYDPITLRLARLETRRGADALQSLSYTYDPVGNITRIQDTANDRVFHNQECVDAGSEYLYDPTYRLIAAAGREHRGGDGQVDSDRGSRTVTTLPADGQALRNYVETYRYDDVGNLLGVRHHRGRDLAQPGQVVWNRRYQYSPNSNRLLATSVPADPAGLLDHTSTPDYSARYTYDAHGSMTSMPHLAGMSYDHRDRLRGVDLGGGGRAFYTYDVAGGRIRKVWEKSPGLVEERIYLGGFEIFRRRNGGQVTLERESLHVMDGAQRLALVETRTRLQGSDPTPRQLIRYQYGDHLGSASLELDDQAQVISYEEYYPYGSTAYKAGRSATETPKRYGFAAKERDEESGLSSHGARHYATWLGRWTSCDPAGLSDGSNLYRYARCNPVSYSDPTGTHTEIRTPAGGVSTGLVWLDRDDSGTDSNGVPRASLTGPSRVLTQSSHAAVPKQAARKPAHATPNPAPPTMSDQESMQKLKAVAERLQPTLTYDPIVTRVMGLAQLAGGALEIAAGVAAEPESAGASTLVVLNGLDTSQSAVKMIATGKSANSFKYELTSSIASRLGADSKLAHAIGVLSDTAGNAAAAGASMHLANRPVRIPGPGAMAGEGVVTGRFPLPHEHTEMAGMTNKRMAELVPKKNIGARGFTKKGSGYTEYGDNFGGNVGGRHGGIWVEGSILRDRVDWSEWNQALRETRLDAVIAHEWIEFKLGGGNTYHALAREIGMNPGHPRYNELMLNITDKAKELLKTMPRLPGE